MNIQKRQTARWRLLALVVLLAVFVAGCANVRNGVSWPALELVEIDGEPRVLVVYDGRVEAINPYQGAQLHVVRDSEGDVMRDANGNVQEWVLDGGDFDGAQFFAAPPLEMNVDIFTEDSESNPLSDTFLLATYNNRLLEVDIDTASVENPAGIELSNGVLAEIVVTDDFIYVPYRQQDVVALDRETYEEVWRFDTQEGVWAQPLLNDGVLYVTSVDHFVYALDANTGEELWRVDLEGAVTSTPLLYENHLYVGSYSHKIYQISLDGTIAAEYEGTNWVWGTPVIQDNVLYYSDLSGYVYALDANGLTEIWAERPSRKGIRPAPIVTDQYVVVAGRDGSVYWLNIDSGSTVQTAELDNRPELLSDMLYIPADEENGLPELVLVASTENNRLVTALNMETFTPQWVYSR